MSDLRLEDFAMIAADWFWEIDSALRFTYLSQSAEAFLGRKPDDLIGLDRSAIAGNTDDIAFWRLHADALTSRADFRDFVYPYAHPDGDVRWLRISGRALTEADGGFAGYRGIGCDVTDAQKTQTALAEQIRRFDAALENMTHGLCMFDAQARLVVCNNRYREIFGLGPENLRFGMTQREIIETLVALGRYRKGLTVDLLSEGTRASLAAERSLPVHRELADGRIIAASHRPMAGGGWVAIFEDVTERRRNEARIAHMARHDGLTDLPNRSALREQGFDLLRVEQREGGPRLAMLCLDLDRFKPVNDSHGHSVGDAVLCAVADRLRANVRDGDIVARLGGDEFALLHRVADEAGALALAHRLIAALSAPYEVCGYAIEIGISVGIAMAGEGLADIERLLKSADMALYCAKASGRGTACVFEMTMDDTAQARRTLERELRDALATDAFEVHYQPLMNLKSGELTGLEALVRWRHPKHGLISPADFIPLAEETGLIVQLGEWVLNRACRDAAAWPDRISIAVNVSPVQLRHRTFAQATLLALARSGLKASRLELEITESVLLDDTEENLEILHLLRRAGIRISMDDFGTGYSSLSYLRRFPFDKIKIDRSFVRDADSSADALAIMRAIVSLGRSLGITTLVEGIETNDQLATIRAEGAQEAQGFLFSKPRPAHEIDALLIQPKAAGAVKAAAA